MATQKLQSHRALAVIHSDTINIPDVGNVVISSQTTATTASKLVDSAADFTANGVEVGDIIYNTTDSTTATVTAIDSATTLSISADIMATTEDYVIYKDTSKGYLLYVGVAGDVRVQTSGGDTVTFIGMQAGQFVPVHVVRVLATSTTATDIIALL